MRERLELGEIFGVRPLGRAAREVALTLRGDPYTPPSRFGPSSLRVFQPLLALSMWARLRRKDRRIPIYNLVNRTPTPTDDGWSVRVTQVEDFRGGRLTYDSHNGTDFAVPVGTLVVAPAAGHVVRVSSEFNRGGLKVMLDHGRGLMTTSNHLARALVRPGDVVQRGDPIALSGASGIDMVFAFPWNAPHVHFNVWLNGETADPFARGDEVPLWLEGNEPGPVAPGAPSEAVEASPWSQDGVRAAIESCRDHQLRVQLGRTEPFERRAADTLFHLRYYPTRFTGHHSPLERTFPRERRLSLPFSSRDATGIVFPD